MSSSITLQDFHAKAIADYGIADLWPEAELKEAKTKKEHITKEIDALERTNKAREDAIRKLRTENALNVKSLDDTAKFIYAH